MAFALLCYVSTNNWSRWWSLISWCSTQKSMNVNQEPPKCMQFLELCWSKVLEEALQRLLRWHGALPVTLLPLQGGCTWAENVTKKQTELSLFSIEYVILIQGGLYHTAKSSWRPPQQYYQNLSTPGGCWAQCHRSQFLGTPTDLIPILKGLYSLLPIHLCDRLFNKYYFLLVIMMALPCISNT